MSIFDAIALGAWKLTPSEDALIWRMRDQGHAWPDIEDALYARRQQRDALDREKSARMLRREQAMRVRARLRAKRAAQGAASCTA